MRDIVTGLTPQNLAALNQALDVILSKVNKVNLTPAERSASPSMGPRRLSFSRKAFTFAKQYPYLLPPVHNIQQFIQVDSDYSKLVEVSRRFQPRLRSAEDTAHVIGANFFRAGRLFYKSAVNCADENISGLTTVIDDLSGHYDNMGRPRRQNGDGNGSENGNGNSGSNGSS